MLGFFVSAANDELKDKPVMSAIAASVVFMICFLCFWIAPVLPVLPAKVSERERRLTLYYANRGVGISILVGSIFLAGLGSKVIEGQSFSTDGRSISNPNRICKKLRGRFGNVK